MDIEHSHLASAQKTNFSDFPKIVIILSAITILITTIPYIIGFSAENDQLVFSGFLFGVEDGNSYIAKMRLGVNGDWLFRTPYSILDQNGLFAFFPYIFLGKFAYGMGLHAQLIAIFHLFRIAGIIFLVFVYAKFLFQYIKNKEFIILGLILLIFGSGWEWVILVLGVDRLPLSFYSPETFGFLSVLGIPHLCFSRGFMLLGILELLTWDYSNSIKSFFRSGIFFLLSALFQPLNLVIAYVVFGLWWLILLFRKKFKISLGLLLKQAITILISLPVFIYYFWIVNLDPFMKQWTAQNLLPSPPVVDYLFAFGPLLVALFIEAVFRRNIKKIVQDDSKLVLILWIAVSFFLVYFPINVQRRLMDGVWMANIVLLLFILNTIKFQPIKWVVVVPMLISPMILLTGAILSVINPTEPQFLDRTRVEIYKNLDAIAQKNAVILAPYKISNEIPAYSNLRVLNGHGPEAVNKEKTHKFLDDLYNYNLKHSETCEFLKENKINYVWFDASAFNEQKIQAILSKNEAELVINHSTYKILKISKCDP